MGGSFCFVFLCLGLPLHLVHASARCCVADLVCVLMLQACEVVGMPVCAQREPRAVACGGRPKPLQLIHIREGPVLLSPALLGGHSLRRVPLAGCCSATLSRNASAATAGVSQANALQVGHGR